MRITDIARACFRIGSVPALGLYTCTCVMSNQEQNNQPAFSNQGVSAKAYEGVSKSWCTDAIIFNAIRYHNTRLSVIKSIYESSSSAKL